MTAFNRDELRRLYGHLTRPLDRPRRLVRQLELDAAHDRQPQRNPARNAVECLGVAR